MFDLLKKKISSFTQKIQETITKKEPGQKQAVQEMPDKELPIEIEAQEKETEQKIFPPEAKIPAMEQKRDLKAKVRVTEKIKSVFSGEIQVTEKDLAPFLEELELSLLEADVEQNTAAHICTELGNRIAGQKFSAKKNVQEQIREKVRQTLLETMNVQKIGLLEKIRAKKPFIVLFLGPNGAGKTTTIAKFTHLLKQKKLEVILAASDTFRAASIEQLKTHAERLGTKVISHTYGADATAVAFDAVKSAQAKKIDVVLIDSAGRQETNKNLIMELKKLERVIKPDLKIFVGEALSGQALLAQAKEFDKEIGIDAFILTKIDTDPKGGTAISLLYSLKKPILFIGTGQNYSDMQEFEAEKIVETIV